MCFSTIEDHIPTEETRVPTRFTTTIYRMNNQQQNQDRAQEIVVALVQSKIDEAHATDALVELGEQALEALSLAMDSAQLPAQRVATIALSRLQTRRALAPILNGVLKLESQPDLMAALLHSAAKLLTPRDRERVRPVLLRFVQHADPAVRLAATECIRATKDDKALEAIADQRLVRHAQHDTQQTQNTVPRAASMDLIAALGDDAESTRRRARNTLLRHPDRDQIIVEHLHHANAHIRRSVLEVAAVVAKPTWNQALMDVASDDERNTQERALALRGVHHLSSLSQDVHSITTLLQHTDEPLRAEAGRLAATSHNTALRKGTLNLLSSDTPWVRKRTAEGWATFADIHRQSDLPHLVDILKDAQWLKEPTPSDIETFQTLTGGIVRMVELGCFIDATLLNDFHGLGAKSAEEIQAILHQSVETLTQSTGITVSSAPKPFDIEVLQSPDIPARIEALESLQTQPTAKIQEFLPQLIRFIYQASPAELLLLIDIFTQLDDQRARDTLQRMAQHPNEGVRNNAIQARNAR